MSYEYDDEHGWRYRASVGERLAWWLIKWVGGGVLAFLLAYGLTCWVLAGQFRLDGLAYLWSWHTLTWDLVKKGLGLAGRGLKDVRHKNW